MDEPEQFDADAQRIFYVVPATQQELTEERERRHLLRRLKVLLTLGTTAFVLTTWMLVRIPNFASLFGGWGSGPETVVESYFEAVNRGELRSAYGMFSTGFRGKVPFEAYHALIVSHRRMFRTRELQVRSRVASAERILLFTRLETVDGEHYLARFTLVQLEGRWWIDDLRWTAEPSQHSIIST